MRITRDVLEQIRLTIGCLPAETGGMLGGRRRDRFVTHFYFDGTADRTSVTYSPDTEQVNRVLTREWNPRGIELLGFVHSHPRGVLKPSAGDVRYAEAILAANPTQPEVLLPIVSSRADSTSFECRAFVASKTDSGTGIASLALDLVDGTPLGREPRFAKLPMFERVRAAYDLDRLQHCRVIAVGCGGAASFVEDLARAGVGEFVLIDPDVVTEGNLATQQTYRTDLGRPKADALADRIRNINPLALVVALQMHLENLSDVEFCWLARTSFLDTPSQQVLVCGMTDDFWAQARVNRLSLNFALPSLCAQVYAEGRGAEVTFVHPEIHHTCHRCLLRSRYRAYLVEGFVNSIGSAGTPFYATARLNATKQFIALMLLHHGSRHPRWAGLLERLKVRNLAQLRLDPDAELPGVIQALAGADSRRLFSDETVWLALGTDGTENPEQCLDCGGDLARVIGSFGDSCRIDVPTDLSISCDNQRRHRSAMFSHGNS